MTDLRLDTIASMIDNQVEVWAIVVLGTNDFVVMPTHMTDVKYLGADTFIQAQVKVGTKLDGTYTVTKVYESEVQAVEALKYTAEQVGIGEYSSYMLKLYRYKFPELWV